MSLSAPVELDAAHRRAWEQDGFLVLRRFFEMDDVQELIDETEWLLRERKDLIDPFNLRCRFMPHHETGDQLFEVFDPVNEVAPVCERFCNDPRLLEVVSSIYGEPACLFKEKLIFKPAGARGYDTHQDIPLAWRNFPRTFLTVLIPIDACDRENGCTSVYPGHHHTFLSQDPNIYMLPPGAVDEAKRVDLVLERGDVAIFHGLTPHGSAPNRSGGMRRAFFVSYNALSDGGDQREAHYATFRERMRSRFSEEDRGKVFYR